MIVVVFMFVCLMRDEKWSSSCEVEKCPLIKAMTLQTRGPWALGTAHEPNTRRAMARALQR